LSFLFYRVPPSFRYSKVFWQNYIFLKESQWWDRKQIEEYQNKQLERLLNHIYKNVPYYRDVFHKLGLKPKDIRSRNELDKFPILDRKIIKENKNQLISKIHLNKLELQHTSGTSGSPLYFYYQRGYTEPTTRAFFWRFWNWHNYSFGDKSLIISGKYEPQEVIYYDPIKRCLNLYNPDLEKNLKKYIFLLYQFQPKIIMGYPSLLFLFSFNCIKQNVKLKPLGLSSIICFSEKLYDWQRKIIEKIFNCKITDGYSHAERLVFLQQCEQKVRYHVIPESGITEFLEISDNYAEIIATGFYNYAFPLVRYRTGDYVLLSKEKCTCGREHNLIEEIIGRSGDFILTPSKKLISPTILEFAIRYINNIKGFQIVQENIDNLNIYIVPDKFYKKEDGQKFIEEIKLRIKGNINYKITLADEIPYQPNQKMRFIKSKIAQEYLGRIGVITG
jgi:phenylacetate-CoA ligase